MLFQHNPNTALYFGHRYAVSYVDEGYMAGGGYILSKKAVKKLVEKIIPDTTACNPSDTFAEDLRMGSCLAHHAIFVDCRDEFHQKRFYPVGAEEHMKFGEDPEYWYAKNQYYRSIKGGIDCCSVYPVGFHYVGPREMHAFEYFIYNAHPFGLDDKVEALPRKLSMQEIIAASDAHSLSPNFKAHENRHQFDSSEIF